MSRNTSLTETKNKAVRQKYLNQEAIPNAQDKISSVQPSSYQQAALPRAVQPCVPLPNVFLLFPQNKGSSRADSGEITAGNDAQSSPLGNKTSSKEKIPSKVQGLKKRRQLFIWTLHRKQAHWEGSAPLGSPGLLSAPQV